MRPEASASSSRWPERVLSQWVLAPDASAGVRGRVEEIWRYRRILWFFATKAVQRLYAGTALGPLWILVRPLAPILTASLVFSQVMQVPSQGVPYFLFLLTGTTIWNFFDGPLVWATRGLEMNRQLLTKLYLPRLIMPVGQMSAGIADPMVCIGLLVASLAYYRVADGVWYVTLEPRLLLAIPAVLMALLLAFALSLWTSVWQARARDMRFVLMYTLGFWYLLTPVVYPHSHLPAPARVAAALNPMTGPVELFKWAVLGLGAFPAEPLAISAAVTIVTLCFGFWYFTSVEGHVVDKL